MVYRGTSNRGVKCGELIQNGLFQAPGFRRGEQRNRQWHRFPERDSRSNARRESGTQMPAAIDLPLEVGEAGAPIMRGLGGRKIASST